MTTLKERFVKQFPRFNFSINESPWDKTERKEPLNATEALLSFFGQELLALAEECENLKDKYEPAYQKDDQALAFGLAEAASLIRSKADEIL